MRPEFSVDPVSVGTDGVPQVRESGFDVSYLRWVGQWDDIVEFYNKFWDAGNSYRCWPSPSTVYCELSCCNFYISSNLRNRQTAVKSIDRRLLQCETKFSVIPNLENGIGPRLTL